MVAFVCFSVVCFVLILFLFFLCDLIYKEKVRRKSRKASRVYKKGMILRMKAENPFGKQQYIYVVDVLKNDDGVMYMKIVNCNKNGDCDVDSHFNVGEGYKYLKDGWLPYKFK